MLGLSSLGRSSNIYFSTHNICYYSGPYRPNFNININIYVLHYYITVIKITKNGGIFLLPVRNFSGPSRFSRMLDWPISGPACTTNCTQQYYAGLKHLPETEKLRKMRAGV